MPTNSAILEAPYSGEAEPARVSPPRAELERVEGPAEKRVCFHCGTPCRDGRFSLEDKAFCCQGCRTVYELLTENGLGAFYELGAAPGVRMDRAPENERFRFVDDPAVRQKLVDYSDERLTRAMFHLPAIHCVACVWLLENLFLLKPGVGRCEVNFPKKELAISFQTAAVRLSEVLGLLASLGYEPELKLSDLEGRPKAQQRRRLWLQVGVAGFAFGNTMLFSIPTYLGLDSASGPGYRRLVGIISLALAVPVVGYSALDYWRSAWISLRQRLLNIDVPIAAGILALLAQSAWQVLAGEGTGYFDSLAGLVFFLLCGRAFQQKTFDRLAFDRDYRSFFPLSVLRRREGLEERVALSAIQVGDELVVRHGELVSADARLVDGHGWIDYSFVTGESEPIERQAGDYLYAGGRQMGGALGIRTVKAVSQGYLTSLWNQEAFAKGNGRESLQSLTNRYSQRFTKLVIGIALAASLFWAWRDPALALKAAASVLIVACPCALALAAPFALGTALRVLGRKQVFLKNAAVIEKLAAVDAVVFDKTGTLTASQSSSRGRMNFQGAALEAKEKRWLCSIARQSTHPLARQLSEGLADEDADAVVRGFKETAGCGMEGEVEGREIWMGSAAWLRSRGAAVPESEGGQRAGPGNGPVRASAEAASAIHVAIDAEYRGCFGLRGELRPKLGPMVDQLAARYELALLSGDTETERARFEELFGKDAELHFNQSPLEKLHFIQSWQAKSRTVVMVGDGLNDAGALRQSDVGIAVVEDMSTFSPASDVILGADRVPDLGEVFRFARRTVSVVRASFIVSALYNAVGISIAARGGLSPVICAILMPLSSVTVVAMACGLTSWFGRTRP